MDVCDLYSFWWAIFYSSAAKDFFSHWKIISYAFTIKSYSFPTWRIFPNLCLIKDTHFTVSWMDSNSFNFPHLGRQSTFKKTLTCTSSTQKMIFFWFLKIVILNVCNCSSVCWHIFLFILFFCFLKKSVSTHTLDFIMNSETGRSHLPSIRERTSDFDQS